MLEEKKPYWKATPEIKVAVIEKRPRNTRSNHLSICPPSMSEK
jgi:hypothetical protein